MQFPTESPLEHKDGTRTLLATLVTIFSILGTISLGVVAIIFLFNLNVIDSEDGRDRQVQVLQFIFTALLPLWGTWIGTVMAYYFSKENFLAANQSVQKLVDQITPAQKLESIKSKDVMIPYDKIKSFPITSSTAATNGSDTEPFLTIKISEALAFMHAEHITRLPFIQEKKLRFVIHQSAFEKFISEQVLTGATSFDYNTATINDMLLKGSESIKGFLLSGAQFIDENSNLQQAQFLIEKNSYCQDVFITATGKSNEPVLGWITNSIIAENARI